MYTFIDFRKLSISILVFFFTCNLLLSQSEKDTVNSFLENGQTPLIAAILKKDSLQTSYLIHRGADVNLKEAKNLKGTPLMYASSTSKIGLVKLLLAKGANIDDVDINGDPAINWAAYYGYAKIIKYLMEVGANPDIESKHGNALDVALRLWHHDSVLTVFKDHWDKSLLNTNEYKLIQAIDLGNRQRALDLLKAGTDPNISNALGIPIMQLAAQSNDINLVKRLLEFDADINILNRVGQSPLAWAARYNHSSMVELLLDNQANPNQTDEIYKLTPLIAAAISGSIPIAKSLLSAGANIDHTDQINGATALHWAIFYGHVDFAKFLIDMGADISIKALDDTYDALALAKAYKQKDLMDYIENFDGSTQQLLGSWKVKEIQYLYKDTTYVMNEVDYGRFIFSKNRYALMYNPMMQARTAFKNLSLPEIEEIEKAFKSIVFNSGQYICQEAVISTIADIAKVPGFEGGMQFYKIKSIEKDELSLTMYDETYPDGTKPEWSGKLRIQFNLKKEY